MPSSMVNESLALLGPEHILQVTRTSHISSLVKQIGQVMVTGSKGKEPRLGLI
jgi:hypothetical protein